jgi:hypothetical protein
MASYYLGTITEVLDLDLYKIKIDIPGLSKEVEAFPMRGDLDEPRLGDQVLVRDVDPIYHSFYLYSELKDDNFIGFRSRGKMIQITEEEINISIFDPEEAYEENKDEIPSKIKAHFKILKNGSIEINTNTVDSDEGNLSADLKGNLTVTVKGNATINSPKVFIEGDSEVSVTSQKVVIDSDNITLKGGSLQTGTIGNGSVSPMGVGPFCSIPICPLTGAPHVGPKVKGIN